MVAGTLQFCRRSGLSVRRPLETCACGTIEEFRSYVIRVLRLTMLAPARSAGP